MSAAQALMASYANPMIVVDGADFDGVNDSMARGAGLTGAADSKSGIFSAWLRLDAGTGTQLILASASVSLFRDTPSGQFILFVTNSASVTKVSIATLNSFPASATWRHLLISWDAAVGATNIYINGVIDADAGNSAVNDTLDYTVADWFIGISTGGISRFNGAMAEFYFAPGQYLDFSLVANRRKFISASGKPVHLGTTGSLPTGTAPLVYQHLDDGEAVANFATNRGPGGNLTITGTLDTASTSPSD